MPGEPVSGRGRDVQGLNFVLLKAVLQQNRLPQNKPCRALRLNCSPLEKAAREVGATEKGCRAPPP